MGQQQLLLLVLSVVLVGLAVVVGIEAFNENQRKSTQDLLTGEAVRLAGQMVAWKMKPAAMAGGEDDVKMESLSLGALGLPPGESNAWGEYVTLDNGWTYGIWQHKTVSDMSAAPHVSVHDSTAAVAVAAFVWGPSASCVAYRLTTYDEDGGRTDLPSIHPPNPDPDTCHF